MNQVLTFIFDNLHPLTTDALTSDSGKWLDVYRRRPQGVKLDLLEYGNPAQHQRVRDKKLTYGDGGTCTHVPPLPTPLHLKAYSVSPLLARVGPAHYECFDASAASNRRRTH